MMMKTFCFPHCSFSFVLLLAVVTVTVVVNADTVQTW